MYRLLLLFIPLLLFTPTTIYWRDAGEFVLSAFYLDIAHPAGFPLYSQLANLFALLPFGPIAWRTNAFSTLLTVINIGLTILLARRLLQLEFGLVGRRLTILTLIPAVVLIFSPIVLKQAYLAEVYVLNCLFILLLALVYHYYLHNRDRRLLLLLAFLAGLSLGNHVTIGLILLPFLLLIAATDFTSLRKIFLPALALGVLGIAIYSYIPVRANQSLSLNTGEAVSPVRFWNLISDKRDRALRSLSEAQDEKLVEILTRDLEKLGQQTSSVLVILAAAGLVVLFRARAQIAGVFLFTIVTNGYFFRGWNPDPWIPTIALIGILTSCFLGALILYVSEGESKRLATPLAVCAVVVTIMVSLWNPIPALASFYSFEMPANTGRDLVRNTTSGSAYITGESWYRLKYLRDIEGYRDDLALVYEQQPLNPVYFRTLTVAGDQLEPATIRSIDSLVGKVAPIANIAYEPSLPLNAYFKGIVQLLPSGTSEVHYQKPAQYSKDFQAQTLSSLRAQYSEARGIWRELVWETNHYLEGRLNSIGNIINGLGYSNDAAVLLEDLCLPALEKTCSIATLNNLAVYLIGGEQYLASARVIIDMFRHAPLLLERTQKIPRGFPEGPLRNLMVARNKLTEAQLDSLLQDPFAAQLLKTD